MPKADNVIETEQDTEILFEPPARRVSNDPVFVSNPLVMPPQPSDESLGKNVAGYRTVHFLAISDQPLSLAIEEANEPEGPYVLTNTFDSSVMGSYEAIGESVNPVGSYMRVTLQNIGGLATILSFKGIGLPI